MDKLSILIADDDSQWCAALKGKLEQYTFFQVSAIFQDGQDALDFIVAHRPDVLLIDIIMPGADGLYIVGYIHDNLPDYHPYIVIVSAIETVKTKRLLQALDVDYYFIKPVSGDVIASNLCRLLTTDGRLPQLYGLDSEDEPHHPRPDNRQALDFPLTKQCLIDEIEDYLHEVGIPLHVVGSKALTAILYHLLTDTHGGAVKISDLYSRVAASFTPPSTGSRVERSIRHAIGVAHKSNGDGFARIYKSHVANKEFVCTSAVQIKRRLGEKFGDQVYRSAIGRIRSEK